MEPQSDRNLQMFLAAYALAGRYYLGVASGTPESVATSFPQPMSHAWLSKKQLIVREAWEIGLNDLDVSGVSPTDDVIIPPDRLNDAPVLELIRWKKSRTAVKRSKKRKKRQR